MEKQDESYCLDRCLDFLIIIIVLCACITSVIALFMFIRTETKNSDSSEKVINKIKEAARCEKIETNENQYSGDTITNSAIKTLADCLERLKNSQQKHTENTTTETVNTLIDYLERLQKIQQNATTNNVMSFLYTTLTTILIALCVYFTKRSRNAAKKADRLYKETKATTKNANRLYNETERESKETKEKISKLYEETVRESNETKGKVSTLCKEINRKVKNSSFIQNFYINIINARISLLFGNIIETNVSIKYIHNSIKTLCKKITDKNTTEHVMEKLLELSSLIDNGIGVSKSDGKTLSEDEKQRLEKLAKQYLEWLQNSIGELWKLHTTFSEKY